MADAHKELLDRIRMTRDRMTSLVVDLHDGRMPSRSAHGFLEDGKRHEQFIFDALQILSDLEHLESSIGDDLAIEQMFVDRHERRLAAHEAYAKERSTT